ncbi:amidase [Virgisporangium aurantiacum]|uniref:Amidohydrolase n=1 Tax=Virgisporangium aurantiacum TaxID=175570 RepID=A0A8J3YYW3_9ACTN|nr:amidase [Virgisporangium aurantiacum]GIJ54559.1 amidohydrolase [Virgisporangium aurantiacum]
MTTGPFRGLTLADTVERLRSGATDPVDLVDAALDAIATSQPVLNAFVTVDAEGARKAARAARDEPPRGPLHGVPVAVKDIVDTAGLLTTMGSRHFAGHTPTRDATVVARLKQAGAVIVGKTSTHEFAYGPTGDRAANGPCANPHDPARMAGGSSSGSAAAVAAGLVPLAVGTDTGGSVRIPAALCGVTGIRPGIGRIPTDGVFPLSWSLDAVGVLATDVAGTAAGWRVLAGCGEMPGPALKDLRVGLPTGFDRLDDVVRESFAALVETLARAGARLRPVDVDDAAELRDVYLTVQSAEAVAVHHERLVERPDLFNDEIRTRLDDAARVTGFEYARALRRLAAVRATAARRLSGLDVLLLPTVPITAPPLHARDTDVGGGWTSPRDALLAHNTPWSVLGLPAISLPIPTTGLPVGAQLVGPPGGDADLLAIAAVVEKAL